MESHLTDRQLEALRTAPLGKLSNRLQIAFALVDVKRADACAATGLSPSEMSKLIKGQYQSLDIEKARKLAEFFHCGIEDLFPARDQQEVA